MKEVRGIRSGFSWRFSSGKASQRQKEWNNGPLNQIRILDRRSIQSRGSGLIFLPSSPCFLPALPIRRRVPSYFRRPVWPTSSNVTTILLPRAPPQSLPGNSRRAFILAIRGVSRAHLQGPRRRLFVKLLFISFIKSSSCPPKEPRTVALDSPITPVSFAEMIYCLI